MQVKPLSGYELKYGESQENFSLRCIAKTTKERKCLRCTKNFVSFGPQNRVCTNCKSHLKETTSFSDDYIYM